MQYLEDNQIINQWQTTTEYDSLEKKLYFHVSNANIRLPVNKKLPKRPID